MRPLIRPALVLLVAFLLPLSADAQRHLARDTRASVAVGDTVRFQRRAGDAGWQTIRVVQVDSAELQGVSTLDSLSTSVSFRDLARIERLAGSYSRGRGVGQGALVGAAVGGLAGGLLIASSDPDSCNENPGYFCFSDRDLAVVSAVLITGALTGIGALAGSGNRPKRWIRAEAPRMATMQPTVRRVRGGAWGVGVRLALP